MVKYGGRDGRADDEEIQRGHNGRDGDRAGEGTKEEDAGLDSRDDKIHCERVSGKELTALPDVVHHGDSGNQNFYLTRRRDRFKRQSRKIEGGGKSCQTDQCAD